MTIRDLWEDYLRRGIVPDGETPEEIALQKCAFVSGVIATMGTLARGHEIDVGDYPALIEEAMVDVLLLRDRIRQEPEPSAN